MLVLCNFLKVLMVSDEMIHRAFRTHATLQTKPIREIFYIHYLPKLYIGFKPQVLFTDHWFCLDDHPIIQLEHGLGYLRLIILPLAGVIRAPVTPRPDPGPHGEGHCPLGQHQSIEGEPGGPTDEGHRDGGDQSNTPYAGPEMGAARTRTNTL